MELILNIFSAFGLSASAGLNAYIPLLVVALLGRYTQLFELNPPWDALTNGWVIGLLFVLSLVEFFTDKIPAVNHINDLIQTFVRPASGAIVFAASTNVISEMSPIFAMGLGVLVAGGVHAVKSAAVRPAVTATTGGTANVVVSLAEDVLSTVVSILSVVAPVLISVFIVLAGAWLISRILRQKERHSNH